MHTTGHNHAIFYLDDDADDQFFFKETLESVSDSYELYVQSAGVELLKLLESPPPMPSMIFIDLNMPQMNGFEVLEKIRKSEHDTKAPVIVFTTSTDEEAVSRCRELGADMFITKPQDYRKLGSILEYVLNINWSNPSSFPYHFKN